MERKGWLAVAVIVVLAFAVVGGLAWLAGVDGCLVDCPTHKLYVSYDGTVDDPIGCCPDRAEYDRARMERAMPGLVPYLERSQTESLVHVEDKELEQAVVDHFGFGLGHDQGAPIEFEGHYYVIVWEHLGDEE